MRASIFSLLGISLCALAAQAAPDYSASTKTVDNTTATPGSTLTYTIRVINNGTAASVSVQDTLPAGMTYVANSTTATAPGVPVNIDVPDQGGQSGLAAGFTIPPPLPSTFPVVGTVKEVDFSFRATVNANASGQICNTANISGGGASFAATTNPCSTAPAPKLQTPELTVKINNVASGTAPHAAMPGDQLQYTVVLSNTGTIAATGVHLHVDAPPFTTGLSVVSQGDGNATLLQSTTGGANGTGEFDLTNMTIPANFSFSVIWQASAFTAAQFQSAGIPPAQINGELLPEQAMQIFNGTTLVSDDPATAAAQDPTTVVMRFAGKPDFSGFIKSLAGSESRQPGDTLVYTLTIPNDGTSQATNVKLTDALDSRLTFVSATATNGGTATFSAGTLTATWPNPLAAGASDSVTLTATLATPLANGTQIPNQAFASSSEIMTAVASDDPATPTVGDATIVTIQSAPDLSGITKTVASDASNPPHATAGIHPGDTVDYVITVPNNGNAVANQIVVTDPVDPRLTLVQPLSGGATFTNGVITWPPAQMLAPGNSLTFTFQAVVPKPLANGTMIANQSTVAAQGVSSVLSDDPTTSAPHDSTKFTVVSAPDLSTSSKAVKNQTHTDGTFHGGDSLLFTIQPINTGDEATTATVITDVLDPNLTFVSATQGGTYDAPSRTVQWNLPAGLGLGSAAPLTFIATIVKPIADGTVINNTGTIASPELPAAGVKTNTVTFTVHSAPDLSGITKVAQLANGQAITAAVAPGTVLLYVIKIPNAGDANATNAQVTDAIDPNLDTVTPQDGGTFANNSITWNVGTIATSSSATVHFMARVKPLTANGSVISNQAQVTSTEVTQAQLSDDPSTAAAHDPTLVNVNSKPDLSTSTKTVAVTNQTETGLLRPGDSLKYTLTIINSGNTYADNVVVKDPLDPDLTAATPDSNGTVAAGAITWNSTTTPALAHLAPGAANAVVVTFTAQVIAAAHDGDVISNQGQLSCDEASAFVTDDPTTTAAKDATKISVHFPVFTVTKTLRADAPRADGTIHPGDFVDYTIAISNSGSFTATALQVDDPIDANLDTVTAGQGGILTAAAGANLAHLDWSPSTTPALASMPTGSSVQLTVRARVKPGTANGTIVSDQAVLRAMELANPIVSDDPSTQVPSDPTRFTVRAIADLHTTTKTVTNTTRSDGTYRPGDTVAYAIAVKNSGDASASHVVVTDALDPALTQVVPANGGTLSAGTIAWNANNVPALSSLAPGGEVDLSFTAVIAATATDQEVVSNQASLTFDELAGSPAQLSDDPTTPAANDATKFTVTAGPRLSHSIKTVTDVSSGSGVIHPGDILEYEIHVLNDGSVTATNVVLTDPPPPQTTYVAGSTTLNGAPVADVNGQSPLSTGLRVHSARAGTADGSVLASSGATPDDTVASVSFRVRVATGAVAGTEIANQGLMRADKVPQAVTDDPSTPAVGDATIVVVGSASLLTAEKSWSLYTDANNNGSPDVGDVIQYSIEVDNRGSTAASTVSVEDDLPSGATYVAGSLALNGASLTDASDGDAGSFIGTHVHVLIGTLAPLSHATVTFRMHLDAAGVISNQAQIDAAGGVVVNSDGDPTLPGIQATLTTVGAGLRADLSGSAKSVLDENGGDVEPGDELTYTITLVNSGGVDTTTALVDDPLPPGLAYVANSAQGDGTIAFTATPGAAGLITSSNVTVKAGGRAQIQFRAKVLANVAIGSSIRNEAGVRVTPADARLALPVVIVVGQAQGSSSVAGRVAWDINGDGVIGDGDKPLQGFQVLVRRADLNSGAAIKTLITDAQGNYRANDLPPAPYTLEAVSAEGTHFADGIAALSGQGGISAAVDLPIQPAGALVRADRSAIPGARMVLLYDDSEVGQAPPACESDRTAIAIAPQPLADGDSLPRAVSSACLRAGQQAQSTGALGLYRFDLVPSTTSSGPTPATTSATAQRHYRLFVLPETPLLTFPGSKPAPTAGFAPPGPVVPSGDPAQTNGARWFQRFLLGPGDVVTNNFVELDSSSLRLVKIATRSTAMIGDIVGYVVTLQNPGSQDMLVGANNSGGVHLADVLPAGLRYAAGSARADRLVATGSTTTTANGIAPAAVRHCPLLSQDSLGTNCPAAKSGPALPETGKLGQRTVGANLDFGPYDLRAGETLELRYQAVVNTSAKPGDAINSAVARSGNVNVSNSDSAIIRIAQDPLFDLSSLIGKVYCETDATPGADHRQKAGEEGVPGVRIYEDEGWFAETDSAGKFHFRGLQPGVHRFKIDVRTLPPGDEPLDDGAITTYLTAGLDARGNFAVVCHRQLVGPDRVTLRVTPPPPIPPRSITADASALSLQIDGVELPLSRGSLRLLDKKEQGEQQQQAWAYGDAREDVIEVAPGAEVKALKFETLLAGGPVPLQWRASLSDAAGNILGEASGAGAPPDAVEITPKSALPLDTTVRAQLELQSDAGRYLSPLLALRVVPLQPPAEVVDSFLLHGLLFEEQNANPTNELGRQLAKAIAEAKAKPELLVAVEVHTAGLGSPDAERALSEQRARAVREAMLAAGIAPERIHARGRGSDVPLAINVTELARLQNRRVAIQLLKPPPPAPAPEPIHLDAQALLEGKSLSITPGQPIAELPRGKTLAVVLQSTSGARAEFAIPKEPLFVPPAPIAAQLDVAGRSLKVGTATMSLPLLGLTVDPLVDDVPSRRVVIDAGGVPRALSFALRAPVDEIVSWRLSVESSDGTVAAELTGEGAPPRRIAWPDARPLSAGMWRARLSVRSHDAVTGDEGRSPIAEFQAAPPVEPVLRESVQAGAFFNGRGKALSKAGLAKAKEMTEKLQAAAGAGGRIEADVFSDDESDAESLTEARANELQKTLIDDGVASAQLTTHARGAALPIAPNATAPGRRANNRVVFSAWLAEKPLPEPEPLPATVRVGETTLDADGANFTGALPSLPIPPARISFEAHLASGAGETASLSLPFAKADPTPNANTNAARPIAPAVVSTSASASAEAMIGTQTNSTTMVGTATNSSTTAPPPPPASIDPQLLLGQEGELPGNQSSSAPMPPPGTSAPDFANGNSTPPSASPSPAGAPVSGSSATSVPAAALPGAPGTTPGTALGSSPGEAGSSLAATPSDLSKPSKPSGSRGGQMVGMQTISANGGVPAQTAAGAPAPPPMATSTMAMSALPAGTAIPLAAHLTADLPAPGTLVRAEALWVRGTTDPRNKLTLNGTSVKLDAQGNFSARAALRRGDQQILLVSTDPNGESAIIERQVHVDPDGLFVLLVGEGDFGQGGAELAGVGDRADFGGLFVKGRAAGVVEGRWDLSQKAGGLFKDMTLSGNFDTARRDDPDAFVELYDPSRYYPVDGDSGLFGQQAQSRGPVYLNLKIDDSHLIIGNFKTEPQSSTEQLFRFDRTLYGIDLQLQKSIAIDGPNKPGLDNRIDLFGADGDLRQHHAHGELRGTGGSVYWLKDSDIMEGSDQVRLVVRDANTGVELTSITETRDVDYTIQAEEGRIIFKQAIPSVADASFLATANYTTALTGHPVFVVIDYDYLGAVGVGGHAGGAHIQETLFGIVTAGGGVASENYSAGSAYTLGGINLGIKPKPHTFLNVEIAKSSGTDAESYASVDGGLTFGSLAPSCVNAATDIYACNSSGRALRIEAGFELADWLDRKTPAPDNKVATQTITAQTNATPPIPMPSGMPGAPAIGPGDLLRANIYFDTRDQGFYTSGGDMDQGSTKAGVLLRWTPDLRTQITGRVDQVASDVALAFDDTTGYSTKRVLRRFSGIQAVRTLGDPDTFAGRFTLTGEIDDTYTNDSVLGTTFADQIVFGAMYRATPRLNFSLYQEGVWNADESQYPTLGDRLSTTLGASYKVSEKLFLDVEETLLWSGNNSTIFGVRSPLFSPQSNVYANERFNLNAGAMQSTTVLGAEEKVASGTRMYGEYQIDNQESAAAQRAVMGLANKWELRPGLFASVGFERAQVIGGIGADLGGGFTGDGQSIPGAAPGATLGGITGQSPIAGTSLNPVATCIPGTASTTSAGSLGAPTSGTSGSCSNASGLGYNPAGAYYPGTTSRDSGTLSIEYLASERFKISAKGELRLDQADQRLVGNTPGVADRLHFLVSVDVSSKWNEDMGTFARVHIAQTQAQNVADPGGPQIAEARWVELTAGLTYRPVATDWLAIMFKATHLIDLRPLDLTSDIGDEQTSDVLAISPTFELPFHVALAEKIAYKHTRDVLDDGPALDTSTWLWVNRLDLHLHKMFDVSGEFRVLALRGPSSGAVGVGGDGESGVLLEVALKPSKYARVGVGWNFTSFSDDELARYDHTAGGFFIRAVGEY